LVGFWTGRQSAKATNGDKALIGDIGNVSSVGLGAECECEDVAHKIETITLFRHIYSRDINQPL